MSAVAAGGFITNSTGQFLLVEETSGKYNFPMGSVEMGESAEEACIREVLEETGLTTRILGLKKVMLVNRNGFTLVKFLFDCEVTSDHHADVEDEDIVSHRYVSFDEFDQLERDGKIRSADMKKFLSEGIVGYHADS